jgi:hypothetical protein
MTLAASFYSISCFRAQECFVILNVGFDMDLIVAQDSYRASE